MGRGPTAVGCALAGAAIVLVASGAFYAVSRWVIAPPPTGAGGAIDAGDDPIATAADAARAQSPPPERGGSPDRGDAEPAPYSAGDPSYREEPDCASLADVSALASAPWPKRRAGALALSKARYPSGVAFIDAQTDPQLEAWFGNAPDTFEGMASRLEVAVHEGSHLWGIHRFDPATQSYPVRSDLTIVTKRLKNFPRSEILKRHVDRAADPYAHTYLDGASGAQGFNTVLDEYNAYGHSLASRYCTRDLIGPNTRTSARDGILAFMYYVETYLAIARDEHPADYAAIVGDPGHRKMILVGWDRAELWLRRSADEANLGIADATLRGWVYDPARLEELRRVRDVDRAAPR